MHLHEIKMSRRKGEERVDTCLHTVVEACTRFTFWVSLTFSFLHFEQKEVIRLHIGLAGGQQFQHARIIPIRIFNLASRMVVVKAGESGIAEERERERRRGRQQVSNFTGSEPLSLRPVVVVVVSLLLGHSHSQFRFLSFHSSRAFFANPLSFPPTTALKSEMICVLALSLSLSGGSAVMADSFLEIVFKW